MVKTAYFRFYEELNDFLPRGRKKTMFPYAFQGTPAVKDAIESLGVPHTEVDLILANSESVSFPYHLGDGDRISVYPVFESLDISPVTHLREAPLREPKFILDVHLGKLAKYLRMLGFDTLYENTWDDAEIAAISVAENRIVLTRDVGLLKVKAVTRGYWIRSQNTKEQLTEVIQRFDLTGNFKPFRRCIVCNGLVEETSKEKVSAVLPPKTKKYYDTFYRCPSCRRVYWKGSHYEKMRTFIDTLEKD